MLGRQVGPASFEPLTSTTVSTCLSSALCLGHVPAWQRLAQQLLPCFLYRAQAWAQQLCVAGSI